jgi:hypothetical protein
MVDVLHETVECLPVERVCVTLIGDSSASNGSSQVSQIVESALDIRKLIVSGRTT